MKEIMTTVTDILTGDVANVVAEFCDAGLEAWINRANFKEKMNECLSHVKDSVTKEQMGEITKNLEKEAKEYIKNQDLDAISHIRDALDQEMNILGIDPVHQNVLKKIFIVYVMTYIHEVNPTFYNALKIKYKSDEEFRLLREEIGKIKEKPQKPEIVLRPASSRVHIENSDRMVSRDDEIADIQNKFDKGSSVIFLHGRPGMGKTTLASLYANQSAFEKIYTQQYTDNLEGTMARLAGTHSRATKVTGTDILEHLEHTSEEERGRILLIIDNFNHDALQEANKSHFVSETDSDFFKRLCGAGIHILVTTRINVNKTMVEVGAVKKPMELFEKIYERALNDEQKKMADELIDIVHGNTMLIEQAAGIWKKSGRIEQEHLLQCLKDCNLKEDPTRVTDKTLYEMVSAMLNFSGIKANQKAGDIFACAALAPRRGLPREFFLQLTECEENILRDLIDGSWVLLNSEENVLLHPLVKEIAIEESMVSFDRCKTFCENLMKIMDVDEPFEQRYSYKDCAWEVYKRFSLEDDNITLIKLYYGLSDVYDKSGELERSKEIAEKLEEQLEHSNIEIHIKARMLSGIAYSIQNSFKDMTELDHAAELLERARTIIFNLPEDELQKIEVKRAKSILLNDFGSNHLARMSCHQRERLKQIKEAAESHERALEYRENQLERAQDENMTREWRLSVANSYNALGTDKYYEGDFKKAAEFHRKALGIREKYQMKDEICVSRQRIIGCVIEGYRKNLTVEKEEIQDALSYFPELLEINFEMDNIRALKINGNYFREISVIIENDRRLESLIEELSGKKKKIAEWIEKEPELERFHDMKRILGLQDI